MFYNDPIDSRDEVDLQQEDAWDAYRELQEIKREAQNDDDFMEDYILNNKKDE